MTDEITREEQADRHIEDLVRAYETGNDPAGKAAALGLAKLAFGALLSIALSLEKLAEDGVTVSGPTISGSPVVWDERGT